VTAQLWVDALQDQGRATAAGVYAYVVTNRLVVVDERGQPVVWEDVPRTVRSEVLRDVELITQVSAVAAGDVEWDVERALERRRMRMEPWRQGISPAVRMREEFVAWYLTERADEVRAQVQWGDGLIRVRGVFQEYEVDLRDGRARVAGQPTPLDLDGARRALAQEIGAAHIWLPFTSDTTLTAALQWAHLLAEDHRLVDAGVLVALRRSS